MNYKKYRWFFTKSGKLVYGGKSAVQNEEIVKEIIKKQERIIMHTKIPGSPFAIIDSPIKKVNESDLEETAVWTACFSRAWRNGLYKTQVDIFTNKQITKEKKMKPGTFAVEGKIQRKNVSLKLFLINQRDYLRAVPEKTLKKTTKVFAEIIPGKEKKEKIALEISKRLNKKIEEVLNALPTGKIKIKWQK